MHKTEIPYLNEIIVGFTFCRTGIISKYGRRIVLKLGCVDDVAGRWRENVQQGARNRDH